MTFPRYDYLSLTDSKNFKLRGKAAARNSAGLKFFGVPGLLNRNL